MSSAPDLSPPAKIVNCEKLLFMLQTRLHARAGPILSTVRSSVRVVAAALGSHAADDLLSLVDHAPQLLLARDRGRRLRLPARRLWAVRRAAVLPAPAGIAEAATSALKRLPSRMGARCCVEPMRPPRIMKIHKCYQ